jgi:acetate kinase
MYTQEVPSARRGTLRVGGRELDAAVWICPGMPDHTVVAHLGGGCSVTAVDARRSVATSMGMTPLEGLMMGTRSGSIDPAIVFRLLRRGVSADRIEAELTEQSGLVGITGRSGMREVVAAAADGDPRSVLAVAMFVSRAAAAIAAAATRLPALDWLIFTGAIGERAGGVRARIVERLAVLGVAAVAPEATGDTVLAPRATGRPGVLVIAAREDLVIAEDARTAARPRRDRTEDPPGQAE